MDNDLQDKFAAALADFNRGRFDLALATSRQLLAVQADYVPALLVAGLAARYTGDLASALAYLESAAGRGNDFQIWSAWGSTLKAAGQVERSKIVLQAAYRTQGLVIDRLEMDVAYACNLHCRGCSHYSNYALKGHVSYEEGRQWLGDWSRRVVPQTFRMLGGEPTLNPRLIEFLHFAREVWPLSRLELVSNGFFMDRHPGIYEALAATRTHLYITLHSAEADYLDKVKPERIREASATHGFGLSIDNGEPEDSFHALYRGEAETMRPFADGNPLQSWRICGEKLCPTLHQGRLWKCPPIAFLGLVSDKFGLAANPEWQPYLQHQGLGLEASDEDILAYVSQPGAICGMCPSKTVRAIDAAAM